MTTEVYCYQHSGQPTLIFNTIYQCRNSIYVSYSKLKPTIVDMKDNGLEIQFEVEHSKGRDKIVFTKGLICNGAAHL